MLCMLQRYLEVSEPLICFLTPRDTRSGPRIGKTCILQTDETLTKPQFSVVDDEMLRSFLVARTSCQIPLSFQLEDGGTVHCSQLEISACHCDYISTQGVV